MGTLKIEEDKRADADPAALSTPDPQAPSPGLILRTWVGELTLQPERWSLWRPVLFGCGAAVYFCLPKEPLPLVGMVALIGGLGLLGARSIWGRRQEVSICLMLLACLIFGFSAAKLRTESVRAPLIHAGTGVWDIEALVVDIASPGQGGQRLLLAPIEVRGLGASETPLRLRLTLRDTKVLPAPGSVIRVKALLNPPPAPASPGAYDFARDSFFDGVGGVGLVLSQVQQLDPAPNLPWRLWLLTQVNGFRWSLANQIIGVMGSEEGGLAAAMITGHEAFIPKAEVDSLRAAGLAHIISISGLHMAIVGGFAFGLFRVAIALWPWLALRVSGKKVAAIAGLIAVISYLILSGLPNPALRAAITACAAFGSILAGRQAITLHTLSLSALVILALQPEAVTEPGFQMSFAATTALLALAEAWPRPARVIEVPWPIRLIQGAGTLFMASLLASFVAGLATGPFAIEHFNRVATYGLLANLLVEPVSSFVMMPTLAVGAVLTPFGLGDWALAIAGWSIQVMNQIARGIASLPGAQIVVASAPGWTLAVSFLGLLWLCLWRGRVRWLGLPLALAVSLCPRPNPPDVWVASDGSAVAVRRGRDAVYLRPDAKLFAAQVWARHRGLREPLAPELARATVFNCDVWSCRPSSPDVPRVSTIWTRQEGRIQARIASLCEGAEVVIVRGQVDQEACPGRIMLDEGDFAAGGSAELYRSPKGAWSILWAQPLRGERPWSIGPSVPD